MYLIAIVLLMGLFTISCMGFNKTKSDFKQTILILPISMTFCCGLGTAGLWGQSYWLHDLRPGDRLSAPPNGYAAWSDEARQVFSVTVVGPASSACPVTYDDIGMPAQIDNLAPDAFSMTVVGKATQWPYRYLVDVIGLSGHPQCATRVLIDAWDLSSIKKTFKDMGAKGKAARMTADAARAEADTALSHAR